MRTLYLIRGLPGAGKSTFAKTLSEGLGIPFYEADMYHMVNGVYNWKPENVHAAHQWCQRQVETYLRQQCAMRRFGSVIVSNTSTTEKELKHYVEVSEKFQYNLTSVIVENRHGRISIHGVPQETLDKMRNRFSVKL